MSQRWTSVFVFVIGLATAGAGFGAYILMRDRGDAPSRQDLVAERGAAVMPFDLDRTTHTFRKTETGGVQTVTINDPSDSDQVPLIRDHLEGEASLFARGNFSDPVSIHGADMPGVRELAAASGRVTIDYRELPDGASITFSSTDAALVDAIHRWFDAQVADHGRHASH